MFPQTAQLSKLLIAFTALVRALSRVHPHVAIEARHCREPLQAFPTRVRSFPSVLSQMRLELIRLNEAPETFRTSVTLFHVRVTVLLVLVRTTLVVSSLWVFLNAICDNLDARFVFDDGKRLLVGFGWVFPVVIYIVFDFYFGFYIGGVFPIADYIGWGFRVGLYVLDGLSNEDGLTNVIVLFEDSDSFAISIVCIGNID